MGSGDNEEFLMSTDDIKAELRDFMTWTRGALTDLVEKCHAIEQHAVHQNGNIKLVMERERDTHHLAEEAREKGCKALHEITAMQAAAKAVGPYKQAAEEQERDEITWLKENMWKLALGGLSLASILDEVISVLSKVSGGP